MVLGNRIFYLLKVNYKAFVFGVFECKVRGAARSVLDGVWSMVFRVQGPADNVQPRWTPSAPIYLSGKNKISETRLEETGRHTESCARTVSLRAGSWSWAICSLLLQVHGIQ